MKPIKEVQQQYSNAVRAITKDVLAKAYKFFENNNHESIVFLFEALIGIMRNEKRADSSSVEMYTKKYEGFMLGLNRIDIKKINSNHA